MPEELPAINTSNEPKDKPKENFIAIVSKYADNNLTLLRVW